MAYVEAFVLQNAFADAGLLWLAAAWRGSRANPLRILLGALLGTTWALVAAVIGGALSSFPAQGVVSALMVLVALGRRPYREMLQTIAALWIGAAILGGFTALGIPSIFAGVAMAASGYYLIHRKRSLPFLKVQLFIRQRETILQTEAIIDSGNRAVDPFTCLPVIFVPMGTFDTTQDKTLLIRTAAGFCVMPFFVPDELLINGQPVRAVVALAPKENLDCALVPVSLCTERIAA